MGAHPRRTLSQSRFAYPEKLAFECTRCGDCCRSWQVMLGPGEPERLRALDWLGRADDLADASVVAHEGNRSILARREDGACVFLGDKNQCRIHEHFGGDAKPLMCRLFPFGFLSTGDRIAVDVSFACRSVSEGTGRALKVRIPEWTELVGDTDDDDHDDTRHRFSKKYDVDGALLWELEHHLLELLSDRSLSIVERVRAVSEFIRLATTSDPRTRAARQLRQIMVSGIPALVRECREGREGKSGESVNMDKTQRAVFFHLLFLLLNPTPPRLRAASGKTRRKEVKRRVQAANGYKYENACPWLDNRELDVDYRAVAAVDAGYFVKDAGAELVERYFEAKIVGQRFMREGEAELPFIEAVPRLLLLFPMLVWTAKALAAAEGAGEVAENHARRGLRLLDGSFGQIRLSELPAKQRKTWQFVLLETELATCASLDMLAASLSGRSGGSGV